MVTTENARPKTWVRLNQIAGKIYPGSKSSFLREVKAGTMPQPITIALTGRAWCEEDIRAELERRALMQSTQRHDGNLQRALKQLVEVDRLLESAKRQAGDCGGEPQSEIRDRAIQLAHSVLDKLDV